MRSSLLGASPRLRRILPWALWLVALAVAVPLALSQAGFGSSPAIVEARVAALSPIRTDHRLRVSKILVTPGQPVQEGELLVQMDTAEVDADLAVAQAKLAYVEIIADWQQMRMHDDRTRTSHALAANAERAAVDVARIVAEAERDRSELTQLDVNLALEEKLVGDQLANADRLKAMRLQRAALAKKVEEYKAAVVGARKSASGSLQRLGDWRTSTGAAKATQGANTDVAVPTVQPDARLVAGELQRKEIARLDLLRKMHEVRAPFAGRVGDILVRVGELSADPAIPMLTLVEEVSQKAVAFLRQSDARKVRPGDRAKLLPRDLNGPALTGRVTALAPSVTELPTRFRRLPNLVEFGRNVYIALDAPADLPGLAYDAVFKHPTGSAP